MTRHIFILLPASVPAGPVKGAYALANALATERCVTLVTLRAGDRAEAQLDGRVRRVCLAEHRTTHGRLSAYRELLEAAGGRSGSASISMCLSADALNLFCGDYAVTCASVRGNLLRNYRADYGLIGLPLAVAHLASLRAMDHVVAMTEAMAQQVTSFSGMRTEVIGNFVDEAALESYRRDVPAVGPLRFTFIGSLSRRKHPLLAVRAVADLLRRGAVVALDLIGDGPMRPSIEQEIVRLKLGERVRLQGFQSNPYPFLAGTDVLVLPSLSEGISRACLEALHLGVPCVVRAVDGNAELIRSGVNGELFCSDQELPSALMKAAEMSRRRTVARTSLLPAGFRQHTAARSYLALVES